MISDIVKLRVLPEAEGRAFAITFRDGDGSMDVEVNYEARTPAARGACLCRAPCACVRLCLCVWECACVCVCVCLCVCVRRASAHALMPVRAPWGDTCHTDEIVTKLEYILNSNGRSDAVVGVSRT